MKITSGSFAVFLLLLSSCTSLPDSEPTQVVQPIVQTHDVGDTLGAYEMHLRSRSASEVSNRLRALVEIVDGRVSDWGALDRSIADARGRRTGLIRPFPEAQSLVVEHDADIDMLRVVSERRSSQSPEGADVGEVRAREIMVSAFDRLSARGLIRRADYDLDTVSVGWNRAGNGARNGSVRNEWTTAYVFSLRRRAGGLPVLNAGVQFAVHRSGQLDSIRLGGVDLVSAGSGVTERPTGLGYQITRAVSDAAIRTRFRSSLPTGSEVSIRFEGLAYVLPDRERTAVVAPLYVFAFSTLRGTGAQQVASRLQTVGYSITDATAPPVYLFETVDPSTGAAQTPVVRRR